MSPLSYFLNFGSYKGCLRKIVLFTIHKDPCLTYIALQEIFKVLNAMSVYINFYWLVILKYQWKPRAGEGGWQIITILGNILYVLIELEDKRLEENIQPKALHN